MCSCSVPCDSSWRTHTACLWPALTSAWSPDALTKPTNRRGSRCRHANGPQVPATSQTDSYNHDEHCPPSLSEPAWMNQLDHQLHDCTGLHTALTARPQLDQGMPQTAAALTPCGAQQVSCRVGLLSSKLQPFAAQTDSLAWQCAKGPFRIDKLVLSYVVTSNN